MESWNRSIPECVKYSLLKHRMSGKYGYAGIRPLQKSTIHVCYNSIIFKKLLFTLCCASLPSLKPSMLHYVSATIHDPNRLQESRCRKQFGLSWPSWTDMIPHTVGMLSASAMMLRLIHSWLISSSQIGEEAYCKSIGKQPIATNV